MDQSGPHNCRFFSPPLRKGLENKQDGALQNKMAASLATVANGNMLRTYTFTLLTSQLDNDDDKEVDPLELDWVTWQRDYMQNKTWLKSRTSILEAMQCNLVK